MAAAKRKNQMKISKIVLEKVKRTLYHVVYLDLTSEQVEEIIESFPDSLVKEIQENEASKYDDRSILNQLSLFLVNKDWPWLANSQIEKEVWDIQMKEAFLYRGYKIRDEG